MDSSSFTRGEKLSTLKSRWCSTASFFMMLALARGPLAAAGAGREDYRRPGRAESHPQRARARRRAASSLTARTGCWWTTTRRSPASWSANRSHNVDADLPLIAQGLNLDLDQLRATLRHYRALPATSPSPSSRTSPPTKQAFIEAHRNELPELETIDEERRLYPRDGFASHLIGYVGEVSEEDLNNPRLCRLRARRRGGQSGRGGDLRRSCCAARTVPAT